MEVEEEVSENEKSRGIMEVECIENKNKRKRFRGEHVETEEILEERDEQDKQEQAQGRLEEKIERFREYQDSIFRERVSGNRPGTIPHLIESFNYFRRFGNHALNSSAYRNEGYDVEERREDEEING